MTVNTIYVHNDSHDSCHSWILVRPPLKLLGDALLALETPGGNAGFVSMWADTTRILVIVYFMGLYGLFIGWVYVYMAWFIWSCFFCVMFIVQKNGTHIYIYIYTVYCIWAQNKRKPIGLSSGHQSWQWKTCHVWLPGGTNRLFCCREIDKQICQIYI